MKKVTIPTCANPFVVIVNGIKYTYPAGETVEVPDDVAAVIEQHDEAHNNPKPEPVVPPFVAAPSESGGTGGGNDGDTLTLAKQYTDEQITKFWTDAEVIDFTTMFDLAQSVMAGGAVVDVETELAAAIHQKMQNGPVKIKVAFNGMTATLFVLAQDFGIYSQFTDFVVIGGALLYMYIQISPVETDDAGTITPKVRFLVQQVNTTPYVPS